MKIFLILFLLSFHSISQENVSSKFFLGIVGGNPISINPTAGMYFDDYGIRLSGGAWPSNKYGVQLDLNYVLVSNNSTKHQVSLISAFAHNRKLTTNDFFYFIYHNGPAEYEYINSFYFGIAYSFLWKGLFVEIGPAWGTGNFEKPRLIGQVGYFHFFD